MTPAPDLPLTDRPQNDRPLNDRPVRVSVIVAAYNSAPYLDTCLGSLRAQTLQDIEFICVDDASTDDSAAMIAAVAAQDPRFRLLRHDRNRGLSAVRNTAIAAARGAYVGAMDGDDHADPDMYARLVAGTADGFYDIVACGFRRVDAHGVELSRAFDHVAAHDTIGLDTDVFALLNPATWNKLWRRTLFTDHGVRYPEGQLYEDAATTPLLVHHARSVNMIGGAPYAYVQRQGSIIRSFSDRHVMDYLRALDHVKDGLIAAGAYDARRAQFSRYATEQFAFMSRTIAAAPGIAIDEKLAWAGRLRRLALAYVAHDDALREGRIA